MSFMLLSAVGLLRFPDFYTRMQAPTKAATLGKFCLVLAAMIHFGETAAATQALGQLGGVASQRRQRAQTGDRDAAGHGAVTPGVPR